MSSEFFGFVGFDIKNNTGAFAALGSVTSLTMSEIAQVKDKLNFSAVLPDTHLMASDFYVPPQMGNKKWVLFYIKHDDTTPILSKAKIILTTEKNGEFEFDVVLMPVGKSVPQPWQRRKWRQIMKKTNSF